MFYNYTLVILLCLCFNQLTKLLNNYIVFSNMLNVLKLHCIRVKRECIWLQYQGNNAILLMWCQRSFQVFKMDVYKPV